MRWALLLLLVPSCQLVFSVDAPDVPEIVRGEKFTARVTSNSIVLARPETVADDDLVIVTVQASAADVELVVSQAGFETLTDGKDSCGSASWHLWVFAGQPGIATALVFTFTPVADLIAIAFSYTNARSAEEIEFMSSMQDLDNASSITLPSVVDVPRGTVAWLALAAHRQITEQPTGVERAGEIDTINIYDAPTMAGATPEILIPVPAGACIGISEVKILP